MYDLEEVEILGIPRRSLMDYCAPQTMTNLQISKLKNIPFHN